MATKEAIPAKIAYQMDSTIEMIRDDQEIFLSAMETAFDSANCIAIGNAKEALKNLTEHKVAADLIFWDLNMPLISAQQFLTEFKKPDSFKDIPVIILSTSSNTATILQTKKLGARDFIAKPDRFNDLVIQHQAIIN